jgi:hypothetical protein
MFLRWGTWDSTSLDAIRPMTSRASEIAQWADLLCTYR